jgi:predicted glycoside hydrolase/deacetylase ChbG (UPF0249 family)
MPTRPSRFLVVVADDYGMGPNTSSGILDVAAGGSVTASVLLVNSVHAEHDVRRWRQRGCPMELGWHPNLTLDTPILPAEQVPSLVGNDGKFLPLQRFVRRWLRGGLHREEMAAELDAQLTRFAALVGHLPTLVNSHQHVAVFPPVGEILLSVLQQRDCFPYVRRVREPWSVLWKVRGARIKRLVLNLQGRRLARVNGTEQFPGNDWLAGITDPKWVKDSGFFARWLQAIPGDVVELMCHPGYLDPTLLGRDCEVGDGLLERRVDELHLLRQRAFHDAVAAAGFRLVTPSQWTATRTRHAQVA